MSTKKIANIAMLVALAIIFSYVEVLIPINIGIPGVKLGLANLVIVIALYSLDMGDVWLISLVRIVLVGFMFGSLMSIAYSLAGAIVSLIAMMIIKKTAFFPPTFLAKTKLLGSLFIFCFISSFIFKYFSYFVDIGTNHKISVFILSLKQKYVGLFVPKDLFSMRL